VTYYFKKTVSALIHSIFLLSVSTLSYAAETVCNDNGGAGWPFPISSTTNITIPFQFGDNSAVYDVNVYTDITKHYVGDLTARVTSPAGTPVLLFERPGTALAENVASAPWGCSQDDIVVTFDDEAAIGTNIENVCGGGVPSIQGTYRTQNGAPNNLSSIDGENPNGTWGFQLVHVAPYDPGTLNQVCITAAFAGVTFDKWVSTNNTCSDTLDTLAVAPGTDVYFCYTALNPSSETFTINSGNATDTQGHDISALETTYIQNESHTVVVGPLLAGTDLAAGTTVNNAQVTATFATANFNGTLVTGETASITVADPVFTTSTKTVVDINGGSADVGDVLRYTITINETAGVVTNDISITDIVDANLDTITMVPPLPAGATSGIVGNTLTVDGIDLPANGSAVIVFDATIKAGTSPGTNIDNTANISHAGSGVTFDAVAPTVVVLAADLSTSTKTVLDVNGGSLLPGDLVRYTITINETAGQAVNNVHIVDVVDANLTSINVTNIGGGTDNSSGNTIDISNINVPASSSVIIEFEANVNGGTSTGTNINNTAIITDTTSGVSTNAIAPALVVNSLPSSGNKILYLTSLNTATPVLTRTVTTANTSSQDIDGNNNEIFSILQSPVFQSPFTITAGTVSVQLNLQSRGNNTNQQRDVEVDLIQVTGGVPTTLNTGTASYTNNGGTEYVTFNISLPSDVNFLQNDYIRIDVRNVTPQQNRRIRVRSLIAGNLSQVSLQSSTVINQDEIGIYAGTYPDVTQYKSYLPGATVYLRSTVSDPFGNADISSVDFTITDPTLTQVFSTNVTVPSFTPSGASAIFETPYLIPATPDGIWSAGYTANEGAEGTVVHSSSANLLVGAPILTVSKNPFTISDPVNPSSYKAIPNAIVEYTVAVENSGFGYVDINSIVLTDPIAAGTTFYFGSPLNPANFIDGLTASGLSFTFTSLASTTDDIDFSNDGGSSFITPSIDANGFDTTSPPINFIRLKPKGEFRGSDGVNNPSMEIKFRVRVN
jgi:uncharacterized repeat protein (TIGR01451 family)